MRQLSSELPIKMTKSFLSPENYLPHDKPMVVIDEVLEVLEDEITTQSFVTEDSCLAPFLNADGSLPSALIIELFAQSIGVWSGFWKRQSGISEAPKGMLLGAREIKCQHSSFKKGSKLKISMIKLMQDDVLASFEGSISDNDEILATGRVNVIELTQEASAAIFKR